jgi:hypothetical protein
MNAEIDLDKIPRSTVKSFKNFHILYQRNKTNVNKFVKPEYQIPQIAEPKTNKSDIILKKEKYQQVLN